MAQAGFYHQPSDSGDDRAMCFTCNVCLVCWEQTDEPWSEHERHSPTCPFVKGEYTQNVPLAVTYATDPATATAGFAIVSTGTQTNIVCTADQGGDVTLWKVKRQLKRIGSIRIRDDACQIMPTLNVENVNECDIRLNAMCTYRSRDGGGGGGKGGKGNCQGLRVGCGVSMNGEPFLVLYALRKSKVTIETSTAVMPSSGGGGGGGGKKSIGANTSAQENENKLKQMDICMMMNTIPTTTSATANHLDATDGSEMLHLDSVTDSFGGVAKKTSSLKNISSVDDQYDEEYIPTTLDVGGVGSIDWMTGGKETDMDELDFYGTLTTSTSMKGTELSKNLANSTSSSSASTSTGTTANTITTTMAIATADGKMVINNDSESVHCKPIQSVAIAPLLSDAYYIADIYPSHDHKYLLVIMRRTKNGNNAATTTMDNATTTATNHLADNNKMDVDLDMLDDDTAAAATASSSSASSQHSSSSDAAEVDVQMFVYQINDNGYINEQPISTRVLFEDHSPVQICMLPNYMNIIDASTGTGTGSIGGGGALSTTATDIENSAFAMVCSDGGLQLIALRSLRTISSTNSTKGKFVSVTYCKNLERLCVCTSEGLLHFYSFYDLDVESDEIEDEKIIFTDASLTGGENELSETDGSVSMNADSNLPSTSTSPMQGISGGGGATAAAGGGGTSASAADTNNAEQPLHAHKTEFSLSDLKVLYELTLFDDMLINFTAEVPVCWNELVMSQKRRHPNKAHDDSFMTKTWRLHNDA